MRRRFAFFLTLLFIGVLAVYIYKNSKDFRPLLEINPLYLMIIAVGYLYAIYLNGLFIKYILKPFDKAITLKQSFLVSLISSIGNYFLPIGTGAGVKAVYLKKKFKLSYTDFLATLSGNYIIVFLLTAGMGLAALAGLVQSVPVEHLIILAITFSMVFFAMLAMALFGFPERLINLLKRVSFLKRYLSIISNILKGWNTISKNRNLLFKLVVLTLLNLLVSAVITFLAAKALGFEITIWALLLYTAISALSLLLNITPGSIGIRESIIILSGAALGLSVSQILAISVIERGTLFLVLSLAWLLVQAGLIKSKKILA